MSPRTRPAREQTFVAFDTETTGLSPADDRVVEIAALAFRADGSEGGSLEQLVNPGVTIPPELTRIHGITDEMVRDKPPIEQVLPDFVRLSESSILVAHNSPYDVSMLMLPLLAMRRSADAPAAPGNLVLDTCALARSVYPGRPNYRLGTVANTLGIPLSRPHRAMSDVAACKGVFIKILEKVFQESGPEATVEELVERNGTELYMGVAGEPGSPQQNLLERSLAGDDGRLAPLREALQKGTAVAIRYHGGSKGREPRLITPITLMTQGTLTFVVAHCHLDKVLKNFRLDKIAAVLPAPA